MGDIIVWGFLIFLLISIIIGLKDSHIETNVKKGLMQQGYSPIEYLGGSPHINIASRGNLKPTPEGLAFMYEGHNSSINTHWDNIKSAELKTHEQITNDVTAGRVLLLGAFALAAKKQNLRTIQYLVVNCEEESVPYNMVFSGSDIGALASRINSTLITYRKSQKEALFRHKKQQGG